MPQTHLSSPNFRLVAVAGLLLWPVMADAGVVCEVKHPIRKVARIFNTRLVELEDRISFLNAQLKTLTPLQEAGLKSAFGVRCGRFKPGDPDPSVTIDLGKSLPLESLFLVPAQKETAEEEGIFPKRFTIQISETAGFENPVLIYTSGTAIYPSPGSNPVRFLVQGEQARYIRLTVHSGHVKECNDLFGLSELVVISDHEPVSFGAQVTAVGSVTTPDQWYPEALTDGAMPLGIWQNIRPSPDRGDQVEVSSDAPTVSWSVNIPSTAPVERIVLYPYQANDSTDSAVFPESLTVRAESPDGNHNRVIYQWSNPLPGSRRPCPLVISTHGLLSGRITVTANDPWKLGTTQVQALSEIEIWSEDRNIARDRPFTRTRSGENQILTSLSDGYSSNSMILPVSTWLEQLYERSKVEQERDMLIPLANDMASQSELHATWGSAVMLGLSFLIPVAIVERRRFLSRNQLEKLRKRITSDLHDDIGSHLGSISLIARTARKDLAKINGPRELVQDLGEMEAIARESSLAMRDIMWLLEKNESTVGDLIHRIRETTGRLCCGMEHAVCGEIDKPGAKLSLDSKRHLFLFYKEVVQNILKQSQAKRVSIRIYDEDDKLGLEISDNGVGLPPNPDHRRPLIQKLEDRARVLEGSLQVHSIAGEGTKILLLVKRSHLNLHPSLS